MKYFLRKYTGYQVSHSNSYAATAFAVVVTGFLVGGYEVTQTFTDPEHEVAVSVAHPAAIARMETIVVTARRG